MIKCVNCGKDFNVESRAPRMMGCGHMFCHFCISTLLYCGELTCPTCKHKQSANGVKDVPLNRALLENIFEEERYKMIPQECLCDFHEKVLKSFCNKCGVLTCDDCYKELHSKEFGCDEVSLPGDESNLEDSAIVKNLNDKIETLSGELYSSEEEIQLAKNLETCFKECYWSLSQYRKYLEVNCEHIMGNLSSFQTSKASVLECSSNSEFMDCCKGLFPLKSHPQTARGIKLLKPLVDAILRKNLPVIYLGCLTRRPNDHPNTMDSLATMQVDGLRFRLGHSFPVDSSALLFDLFKELNSKHLRRIRLSWPLDATKGEESNNQGKSVHADIELFEDQVETFYKILRLGKEEGTFPTNNYPSFIIFHKISASNICIWPYPSHHGISCKSPVNSYLITNHAKLGLHADDKLPDMNNLNIGEDQWPVLALVSDSAPELVFVKFNLKQASNSFQLVGTWRIGGDVKKMPNDWQSTSWRLSPNS